MAVGQGPDLELLQSSEPGDLVRGLRGWRDKLRNFLRFPLLASDGVLREGVRLTPAGTLVPFDGSGAPRRVEVFNIRASAPVSWARVPGQSGDRGVRIAASAECTADVWMVP